MKKTRAIIYISPPIAAVLDAVPGQSVSGRLADVCARYMRMVEDELARTQFAPGEWEAICLTLGLNSLAGLSGWRFSMVQRIAMLEQFERDAARRNSTTK